MSTLTFPRVVADLDGNSWPWWAFKTPLGDVLWTPIPTLPFDGAEWADETDPIGTEHVVLDEAALTELLYSSSLSPDKHPTRQDFLQTIEARLYAYRCHVEPEPHHTSPQRLAECRAWAAELIGGAL